MSIFSNEGFRAGGVFNNLVKLSTTDTIPGHEITACIGLVYAVGAGVSLGNRKTIEKSYNTAIDELINQAIIAGANAISGIKFSCEETLIHAYGTAVIIKQ